MRVAVGCFAQESNTFSPVPGSWLHFGPHELLRGQEILHQPSETKTEVRGILDAAQQRGIEMVPLVAARPAASAGSMLRGVFESIQGELIARLRSVGPVDGVILVLHGAMVAEGYEDATGEVLRAVRAEIGPDLPLIGTLDLHANVTQHMVDHATTLVGYHTFPHVDMYETGQRGMELLSNVIRGRMQPVNALRRLPMILPGENGQTTEGPFAEVMEQVRELEKRHGIVDVSVFAVQPWLDVQDVGCSVLVIADGDSTLAETEADHLAEEFWKRRHAFEVDPTPTAEAVRCALDDERHPYVLSDSADAPSSGAPGDSPVVLAEVLQAQPTKDCYLNIVDPDAVKDIVRAGVGTEVTLSVGARFGSRFYHPVEVTGTVETISDGDFIQKGPGFQGVTYHRGPTGVLRIGHIYLVIMERPVMQWDPELYRSVRLEPRDAQIVVVKSPAAFRAAYEPFAAAILILDAPGVCSPNLRSLPFKRVRRPLYPLDDLGAWRPLSG